MKVNVIFLWLFLVIKYFLNSTVIQIFIKLLVLNMIYITIYI